MNPYNNMANPNISPQYNQNVSHQGNPNISVNPSITNSPNITVNVVSEKQKKAKTFIPLNLGREPEVNTCPHCEEEIAIEIYEYERISIRTVDIGLVLFQACKGKSIDFEDCELICPTCRR